MSRIPEYVEDLLNELRHHNIEPTLDASGKHPRISWEAGGRRRQLFTSATPSDFRAGKNALAQVRRWLREDNVLEATVPEKESIQELIQQNPTETRIVQLESELFKLRNDLEAAVQLITELQQRIATPPSVIINIDKEFIKNITKQALPVATPVTRQKKEHTNYDVILSHLRFDRWIQLKEIFKALPHMSKGSISSYLTSLKQEGEIENAPVGLWKRVAVDGTITPLPSKTPPPKIDYQSKPKSLGDRVMSCLHEDEWISLKAIYKAIGTKPQNVSNYLHEWKKKGLVINKYRGLWKRVPREQN